ncbi:hypothetical protein KCP70_01240 [Salmonella enterica subsp. enterica]|nr:hypothetical protein KCP70_01240 [Salmonella enterica subsp. enterica]
MDATHGMRFLPAYTLNDSGEITLTGGEGIGTWQRGVKIGLPLGSAAVIVRHAIPLSLRCAKRRPGAWGRCGRFCPEGEVRAQKTYKLAAWHSWHFRGLYGVVTPMSGKKLETLAIAGTGIGGRQD